MHRQAGATRLEPASTTGQPNCPVRDNPVDLSRNSEEDDNGEKTDRPTRRAHEIDAARGSCRADPEKGLRSAHDPGYLRYGECGTLNVLRPLHQQGRFEAKQL